MEVVLLPHIVGLWGFVGGKRVPLFPRRAGTIAAVRKVRGGHFSLREESFVNL